MTVVRKREVSRDLVALHTLLRRSVFDPNRHDTEKLSSMPSLADPFTLPCGATLKNRIAKAAMTEQLADADGKPNVRHIRLYERWSEGGAGLLITGNVQVDRKHLEHPANVVIDGNQGDGRMKALRAFADAAQTHGAKAIMQISHAGRQTPAVVNPTPLAPSAIELGLPGSTFGKPKAMTAAQLNDVESRFAYAAKIAAETGFAGVQIHAAHGYLLSSFLNPRANKRQDPYGGKLAGRAKLLLRIVERIRAEAPKGFIVSVKLNSSDFQKGGLSTEDSLTICGWLAERGVDLLEISGGNYEQPAMMDLNGLEKKHEEAKAESTKKREAYFLEFAEAVRTKSTMPLMVTGGFRTKTGMDEALSSGACDVVGIARPLCVKPALPNALLSGEEESVPSYEKHLRIGPGIFSPQSPFNLMKMLNGFAIMAFFYTNIERMADGQEPTETMNIFGAFVKGQRQMVKKAKALL
ncbi:MAG: NADH:flavin oxidoreductase/NADH oxidase family protein [Pseudomonadota bacterium]